MVRKPELMKNAGWMVSGALLLPTLYVLLTTGPKHNAERARWDRERDSLGRVNAALLITVDSLMRSAQGHADNSDSLTSVPRIIYIEHAARLTRNASLDSLGRLLGADPFAAVPDTLVGDDEPR